MTDTWTLKVNGVSTQLKGAPDTPLIWPLRNQLELLSVRYGCGLEDCGCCRILLDKEPAFACSLTLAEAQDRSIDTLEGLQQEKVMQVLQDAFLRCNAGQCGYCLSGILVTASSFLTKDCIPKKIIPDRRAIQTALNDHLCRCGAHNRIIQAISIAANELLEQGDCI